MRLNVLESLRKLFEERTEEKAPDPDIKSLIDWLIYGNLRDPGLQGKKYHSSPTRNIETCSVGVNIGATVADASKTYQT